MPSTLRSRTKRFHERLQKLGFISYRGYLASETWRRKKKAFYALAQNQSCFVCRSPYNLVPHHVSYARLGHETVYSRRGRPDLIALCQRCHKDVHALLRGWIRQGGGEGKIKSLGGAHIYLRALRRPK